MPEWAQFSWWLWNGGRIPPAVQPAECWPVWSGLTASADVQEFFFWLDRGVLLLFRAQVHSSHSRFMGLEMPFILSCSCCVLGKGSRRVLQPCVFLGCVSRDLQTT